MHLDLHVHSSCSDGTLAPAELVVAARRSGLGLVAIADHDTAAGIAPAEAAARGLSGIAVLPAIEVTCFRDGQEVHLLGYGIRPGDGGIGALSARAGAARRRRIGEMCERLRGLGVAIEAADVTAPPECASVGRMHLARALVRRRAAGSVAEAFARFIGDGAPAHVRASGPDVAAAIAAIRAAGGIAVWAHPAPSDADHFAALREAGLEGIEVLRPSLDPVESVALEQAARAAGLLSTGGSDWHGGARPALGAWYVTEHHVGAFLERLAITTA